MTIRRYLACCLHLVVFLLASVLHDVFAKAAPQRRTINADDRFTKWTEKTQILFYLDTNYRPDCADENQWTMCIEMNNCSVMEQYTIRQAARKIGTDLTDCIKFVETSASDPRYKIHVTPLNAQGSPETYCSSYPGMVAGGKLALEQRLQMARGATGCVDSVRKAMKYWAIVLGKRNEHERMDRDLYITVNQADLALPQAYALYAPTKDAFWGATPYDFCSITHNAMTEYAKPGMTAFTFKTGPQATPTIARLSQNDCQVLNAYYFCDTSRCPSFDCTAARLAALTAGISTPSTKTPRPLPTTKSTSTPTTTSTTTPSTTSTSTPTTTPTTTTSTTPTTTTTTTPTTTTTTTPTTTSTTRPATTANACPLSNFCYTSPDESTYLDGPFQQLGYALLTGSCVQQYTMNFDTMKLETLGPSELITTFYPTPGGPTMTPPVTFAYHTMNDDDTFTTHLTNQAGGKTLLCSRGTIKSLAGGIKCPMSSSANDVKGTSIGTSATSQLYQGNNKDVFHYVVNTAQTELSMMSEDFSKTCQTTTNFLGGQTMITKITAIQILQDLLALNDPVLAVFGTGSDGKPYVGYVSMALNALCSAPLDKKWNAEPLPLTSVLTGC